MALDEGLWRRMHRALNRVDEELGDRIETLERDMGIMSIDANHIPDAIAAIRNKLEIVELFLVTAKIGKEYHS